MVQIVVADDASGPEHLAALRTIEGIEVVAGECNEGFAVNVNRGLRAVDQSRDVVVLNSDMEARPGWLACLQYAASQEDDVAIVGARLLYPDGRIQFAGTVRNLGAPEWFDHRYRFKPSDWGPAALPGPVLAVTGACMYVRRERDRADRPAGRALPDGLRGRRLVPARLAGRDAGGLLPGRLPGSLRVGHQGHRRGRARARVPARLLGALGIFLRRARGPHGRGQAEGRLRDRGHRRGRRAQGYLRAPQPPGRARTRGGLVHAGGAARLVRAPRPGPLLRVL